MRALRKQWPPADVSPDGQDARAWRQAEQEFLAGLATAADRVAYARTTFDSMEKRKLRAVMYREQGELCVYCERRVSEGQPTPRIEPAPPAWQHALATVVHWVLYLFMIGMPLGGWLMLSAAGKPIPYFGLELPSLVAPDKALATQVKEIHETIGKAGYALIGLHAVAALFHHHVLKDDTLTRMLPRRGG